MMWSPDSSSRRSGWCRTTCDGAWPGVSYTCQGPRSVSTSTPGSRSRSGGDHVGDADPLALARLAVALQRGPGHPAVQRHLDAPLELAVGVGRGRGHVPVVGVHPQLAPGALDDRRGQAVVVGVRVRAHEQAHVLEPQAGLVERALELCRARRARACRCRPAPRRCRPRSRTRSRAARPATAAAGAAATGRAGPGRRGPARACARSAARSRVDQHAGVEDPGRVELALGGPQRGRERVRAAAGRTRAGGRAPPRGGG